MIRRIAITCSLLLAATTAAALEPVAKIIAQPTSPVTVTFYSARYQEGGRYTTEGIRHNVEYKNTSNSAVVAVRIGLVSFDVWNEFLDRTGGVSIEDISPSGTDTGAWVARAYADFSFLTGFAYISKVRFADGRIWEADLDAIANEMRKIERNFDVEKLKGKEDEK